MRTTRDESEIYKIPLPGISVVLPAVARTKQATALADAASFTGIRSNLITQATREAGSMLYEILGMVELMRVAYEKGEWERAHARLNVILKEAAALSSAFATIIESGKPDLQVCDVHNLRFDIVALLNEVSRAGRMLVQGRPVTLTNDASGVPLFINSDPDMVRHIMMGLVNNAATYTDRGRIALIMNREDDWIRLTVTDNGRGMSQEQIDAVQVSSPHRGYSKKNRIESTSHGLNAVKDLVRLLHGSMTISSKLGVGTIVEVRLPLEPQDHSALS